MKCISRVHRFHLPGRSIPEPDSPSTSPGDSAGEVAMLIVVQVVVSQRIQHVHFNNIFNTTDTTTLTHEGQFSRIIFLEERKKLTHSLLHLSYTFLFLSYVNLTVIMTLDYRPRPHPINVEQLKSKTTHPF